MPSHLTNFVGDLTGGEIIEKTSALEEKLAEGATRSDL